MATRWLRMGLILLVAACSAEAQKGPGRDWKQVSDSDGVKVWVKEVPGKVSTVRASGVIDAPPERVLAVLADVEAYEETMPHTEESRLVKREGNDIWMYSVIDPPLGAKRDYAVKITLREEPDGTLGTSWVAANEVAPPVKDGVVRVEENEGSWTLTPLQGGRKTGAVYILRVNPGGSVPKWIADRTNRTSVPDAFKAVRKAATSKRYANAPSPLEEGAEEAEAPSEEGAAQEDGAAQEEGVAQEDGAAQEDRATPEDDAAQEDGASQDESSSQGNGASQQSETREDEDAPELPTDEDSGRGRPLIP